MKPKTAKVETAQRTFFPESYQQTGERVVMNIENIEPREAYFINGTAKSFKLDGKSIGRILMPEDGTNVLDEERKWILSKEMVGGAYNEIFMWSEETFSYTTQSMCGIKKSKT